MKDSLDAAVGQLMKDLNTNVLGKKGFEKHTVRIDRGMDLDRNSLDRIRKGKWVNNTLLQVGMQICDKLPFIRCGESVDLDQPRHLASWRERVDAFVERAPETPLVLLCPLNLNRNHYTLLEINYRTRTIYHYDSMADRAIIMGETAVSRVGQIVKARITAQCKRSDV
jgi:Ulp1 protease family, C-terminal catalytic domain